MNTKFAFVLQILIALLIILPCVVFGQTIMHMDVTVSRIPVTHECSRQNIWMLYTQNELYIQTSDDTLKLHKMPQPVHYTERSELLYEDLLHNGQKYGVRFIESDSSVVWRINPLVRDRVVTGQLHSIIISSSKKCKGYANTKRK